MRRFLLAILLGLSLTTAALAAALSPRGELDVGVNAPPARCVAGGECLAMPLRALTAKYPIRWCAGYTPAVGLDDYYGWQESLGAIGVEMQNACTPYWLVSVWVIMGDAGTWAAYVSYDNLYLTPDYTWEARTCTIHINNRRTTDINTAIYWDKMNPYQRQSLVNHEFGHCLGFTDGGPGVMWQNYSSMRPTAENKEALLERFPYSDPVWYRYMQRDP